MRTLVSAITETARSLEAWADAVESLETLPAEELKLFRKVMRRKAAELRRIVEQDLAAQQGKAGAA